MRMFMTSCARRLPERRMPNDADMVREIFRIIRENCAVPFATATEPSALTCNFCRMWNCRGSRYSKEAEGIKYVAKSQEMFSLSEIMAMDVNHALEACKDLKVVRQRLQTLKDLGLGYLTLGEATPSLSGGEAQRLKLASEMGRRQEDSIFVFDEPTIGLHPRDVKVLINVFQKLIDNRATIIVIEHDLDVIRNADYVIDMGPEGGKLGGEVVFSGTPEDMVNCPASKTGRYLK